MSLMCGLKGGLASREFMGESNVWTQGKEFRVSLMCGLALLLRSSWVSLMCGLKGGLASKEFMGESNVCTQGRPCF